LLIKDIFSYIKILVNKKGRANYIFEEYTTTIIRFQCFCSSSKLLS